MLITELHTSEAPNVFSQFKETIGESCWLDRIRKLMESIKGLPFLKQHLLEENKLAIALGICSHLAPRDWRSMDLHPQAHLLYPALTFAAQTLSIIGTCNKQQKKEIVRRIQSGFKEPDALRAMSLELTAATHFVRRGHRVSWPEMDKSGNFDLLVHDVGGIDLEVECKLITEDKGRKIHQREALVFHHLVKEQLEHFTNNLTEDLAVILTIPDRLPTDKESQLRLIKLVSQQIIIGMSGDLADGSSIRLRRLNQNTIDGLLNGKDEQPRTAISKLTSTENQESIIFGRKGRGGIIFVTQSKKKNSLIKYTFETLDDAAKRQLSKNRPGILLACLYGIDSQQLQILASEESRSNDGKKPSPLQLGSSKLLNKKSRNHVVNISFLSRSTMQHIVSPAIENGGSVYYFNNTESSMWNEKIVGLFT